MGSFTPFSATNLMAALFPTATTSSCQESVISAISGIKIYNSSTTSSNDFGIYSSGTGANVIHRLDLVSGAAPTEATVTSIGLSGTPAFPHAATPPGTVVYGAYLGAIMVAAASGNHAWLGWSISDPDSGSTLVSVKNNGQIAFPTNNTVGQTSTIYGFVLSAVGNTTVPTTVSNLIATPTSGAPVIIAYGSLSSSKAISTNDTPVFTNNAISITLD